MTRPAPRWPLTILTWNMKVGRRPRRTVIRGLRQLIKASDPDVVALQEAMNYVSTIRLAPLIMALFRVITPTGWTEATNCPLLVRRWRKPVHRTQGVGWGFIRNTIGWVGPLHDIHHPGRTWSWAKVAGVYVVSLHRCWGGGTRNRAAYVEEYHQLVRFIRDRRYVVVVGDTNTPWGADWIGGMEQLAEETGCTLVADPQHPGIDYAAVKGLDATARRLPDSKGSDHRPVLIEVTGPTDTAA